MLCKPPHFYLILTNMIFICFRFVSKMSNSTDFRLQTSVLCHSFLLASTDKQDASYLIDLADNTNTDLNFVPNGQEIIKSLLQLVRDFNQRFSRTHEIEPVAESLGIDSDKPVDKTALEIFYLEILDGLFEKLNWGRIVAMFAFLRILVLRLSKHGHSDAIKMLIKITSQYSDEKLKSWIDLHDGWSGLIEFSGHQFVNDGQELIWKTLRNVGGLATGAVGALGLAALVSYIANKI
uniref:Apoptosis regulator R11 n=3 Tax=Schistosoma TaxID=6181 RepID=A0A095C252_SCHHA